MKPRDAGELAEAESHSAFDGELWRERAKYPVGDGAPSAARLCGRKS